MKNLSKWLSLLVFLLFISGCGSPLDTFQEALEKTNNLEKGKSEVSIELNVDGPLEGEEFESLFLEKLTIKHEFDKTKEKSKSSIYTMINNVGIDLTVYEDGENTIVTSPLLPKLVLLDAKNIENMSVNDDTFPPQMIIASNTEEAISTVWYNLLTNENVSKLGNVIVTTPDGDVKGKEFEIHLTKEQLQPALMETVSLYLNDPNVSKMLKENDQDLKLIEEKMIDFIQSSEVGPVSYYAYIDRDSYIIDETFSTSIHVNNETNIKLDFQIQRWDLGNEVDIEVPTLTEDNVMTINEFINGNSIELFK